MEGSAVQQSEVTFVRIFNEHVNNFLNELMRVFHEEGEAISAVQTLIMVSPDTWALDQSKQHLLPHVARLMARDETLLTGSVFAPLKAVKIEKYWNSDLPQETKDAVWSHLQTLCFLAAGIEGIPDDLRAEIEGGSLDFGGAYQKVLNAIHMPSEEEMHMYPPAVQQLMSQQRQLCNVLTPDIANDPTALAASIGQVHDMLGTLQRSCTELAGSTATNTAAASQPQSAAGLVEVSQGISTLLSGLAMEVKDQLPLNDAPPTAVPAETREEIPVVVTPSQTTTPTTPTTIKDDDVALAGCTCIHETPLSSVAK